jgi:ribose 5-phosphate isomerase A
VGKSIDINVVYARVKEITGLLETGLFANMCKRINVYTNSGAKTTENDSVEID